jgi:excisionase family DNA binding protein
MKSQLEQEDIELIAQRVIEKLKPMLSNIGKPEGEEETIFTVESLAHYLQVDKTWVYKAVSLKTLPHFKSGKYTRFRKKDIDKWIQSQTVKDLPSPTKLRIFKA